MFKTSKWYDSFGVDVDAYPDQAFLGDDGKRLRHIPVSARRPILTPDERHRLALMPFPIVRVTASKGHAMGPAHTPVDQAVE